MDPSASSRAQSFTVTVEPSGIELKVNEGETIMSAAERSGYRWPTLCHGDGTCSICWFEVKEGGSHLSDVKDNESETLNLVSPRIRKSRTVRLGCQARLVGGDVVIRKPGVRPAGEGDSPAGLGE